MKFSLVLPWYNVEARRGRRRKPTWRWTSKGRTRWPRGSWMLGGNWWLSPSHHHLFSQSSFPLQSFPFPRHQLFPRYQMLNRRVRVLEPRTETREIPQRPQWEKETWNWGSNPGKLYSLFGFDKFWWLDGFPRLSRPRRQRDRQYCQRTGECSRFPSEARGFLSRRADQYLSYQTNCWREDECLVFDLSDFTWVWVPRQASQWSWRYQGRCWRSRNKRCDGYPPCGRTRTGN